MAIRPAEDKIYKWKYPPEKDDPEGMIWHINPEVFEGRLQSEYMKTMGDVDSFDSFVHKNMTAHVVKLEIPTIGKGKAIVTETITDSVKLDKLIRRLPRSYGDSLMLSIQGIGDFLDEGLVGN